MACLQGTFEKNFLENWRSVLRSAAELKAAPVQNGALQNSAFKNCSPMAGPEGLPPTYIA
jgi:hypothetical protein